MNNKIRGIHFNNTQRVGKALMQKATENGLKGNTRSLVSGDLYDDDTIIKTLMSLGLIRISESDIMLFKTEDGFDFFGFLNYCYLSDRFSEGDLSKLKDLVFIKEIKENPEPILKSFLEELESLKDDVDSFGIEALIESKYDMISFLVSYACQDSEFRIANKDLLVKISRILNDLGMRRLESLQRKTFVYKGVTIETFGNNVDALAKGLQKVMQAIDLLPEPILKQLANTEGIKMTDQGDPTTLFYFMSNKDFYEDKNFIWPVCGGSYEYKENAITLFQIDRVDVKKLASTLAHETGHAIDYSISEGSITLSENTQVWSKAKERDKRRVSLYGNVNLGEDFAEMCRVYCEELMKKGNVKKVRESYPHRVEVLEAMMDLLNYDPENPESLPIERKYEIMRVFEGEITFAIEKFMDRDAIFAMSPEQKIAVAQQMIQNGVPKQFTDYCIDEEFFMGFNADQLCTFIKIYEPTGVEIQSFVISVINMYAISNGLVSYTNMIDELNSLVPMNDADREFLELAKHDFTKYPQYFDLGHELVASRNEISYELYQQLVDLYIRCFGRSQNDGVNLLG